VNYGSVLRRLLVDGLGATAVHVIDPKAQPFADAQTRAAITCFRIGVRPTEITMRSVGSVAQLVPLSRGRANRHRRDRRRAQVVGLRPRTRAAACRLH
jgi:hypothetical protein